MDAVLGRAAFVCCAPLASLVLGHGTWTVRRSNLSGLRQLVDPLGESRFSGHKNDCQLLSAESACYRKLPGTTSKATRRYGHGIPFRRHASAVCLDLPLTKFQLTNGAWVFCGLRRTEGICLPNTRPIQDVRLAIFFELQNVRRRLTGIRCMDPVWNMSFEFGNLIAWNEIPNQRAGICFSGGSAGGMVKGPTSLANSTGSRRARVAAQYLGASSR